MTDLRYLPYSFDDPLNSSTFRWSLDNWFLDGFSMFWFLTLYIDLYIIFNQQILIFLKNYESKRNDLKI